MKTTALAFLIYAFFLQGCVPRNDSEQGPSDKVTIVTPIDYGHGIYYFNCTERMFATSLSAFLGNDSTIQILSITGDGTTDDGEDKGYFVIIRKLK